MKHTKIIFFLILTSLTINAYAISWEHIQKPIEGTTQSIGEYSNGCIIGSQALPLQGEGYQVIRSYKNRFYGHTNLISFIKRLGKNAKNKGLSTVLVGDMGMPAGGRFTSGHKSHQTGLDADIWLRFGPLTKDQANLIKLAATDNNVARIFVNPAIKVELCQATTGDRSWLRKVRPWFGHTAHMHVRLNCPKGSKECKNQATIPAGEGCGATLYSWFEPKKPSKKKQKKKPVKIPPLKCQMLLWSYE